MNNLLVLFLGLFVFGKSAANYLREKPPYMTPCLLSDANFNSCYANSFQTLFKEWKDGVPGLKGVGALDPLHVKKIKIAQASGPLVIRAELTNVLVQGASKAIVREASISRKDFSSKLTLFLPKMRFDGDYIVDGKVLSIALKGSGKAYFEAENILLTMHIVNKLHDHDGFTFSDISALNIEVKSVEGFRMHLDNLFGGQKELEDSTNAIFNENWRTFFDTMRPVIEQTTDAILLDRFQRVFKYVPTNYFIADITNSQ